MTGEIHELGGGEIADLIRSSRLSPVEALDGVLARIEQVEPVLHSLVALDEEGARRDAREAADRVSRGDRLGPLHGVPLTVKDLVATEGIATRFGSLVFRDHVPTSDAPAVTLLKGAGAVNVGKTTTPEFGHKGVTDSLLGDPTRNPWDLTKTAGGSSGGAGAALAAGIAPLAVGTDGGGSIRVPASFCGVVGIKPTTGSVPTYPPSLIGPLGHTGPMARSVRDVGLLLAVMQGEVDWPAGLLAELDRAPEVQQAGLRVGLFESVGGHPVDPEVLAAAQSAAAELESRGARVSPVEIPCAGFEEVWDVLFDRGMLRQVELFPAGDRAPLSASFQALVDGLEATVADAQAADARRVQIVRRISRLFGDFDVLLGPTVAVPAFPLGIDDPDTIAGIPVAPRTWWRLTQLWNLTGNPACSVPYGFTRDGLPIGIQLVGAPHRDHRVLRVAAALEQPFRFPDLSAASLGSACQGGASERSPEPGTAPLV